MAERDRELQKTKCVRDGGTGLADCLGQVVVRVVVVVNQLLVRLCHFDRVQVHALDVLDECPFAHGLVVEIFVNLSLDGSAVGEFRCTGTAFTADDLVTVAHLADSNRLDKAVLFDGFSKFDKFIVIEELTRLERVRVNQVDVDFDDFLIVRIYIFVCSGIVDSIIDRVAENIVCLKNCRETATKCLFTHFLVPSY